MTVKSIYDTWSKSRVEGSRWVIVKPLTVLRDATGVSSPNYNKKDQMNIKVVC